MFNIMEILQNLTCTRDHWYPWNGKKGNLWINEARTSACPDLVLPACSIHKPVMHQGFRYSPDNKNGSGAANISITPETPQLPLACSEEGSDPKGQMVHLPVYLPPPLNHSAAHLAGQLVLWIQRLLIRDVCTSLTITSYSSTLFSLWIRYKHCTQGAKSSGSCLINTGYIFEINIPSHPAAESYVCLIFLQWVFRNDSEALSEAGGFWKTNSFLCCCIAHFGSPGHARRSCAVKNASDS